MVTTLGGYLWWLPLVATFVMCPEALVLMHSISDEEKQEKTTVSLFHIFFLFLFSLINDTHGSLKKIATIGGYLWWLPLVAHFGGYLC